MLEPTKKDTLHPKTKKKPQRYGRSGTIVIKSNPIHDRWVTHKLENNYTTEGLHRRESSEPHIRLPSLGVWQWEEELQRIWLWRWVGFDCRNSTKLGETETQFLKGAHSVLCTPRHREKSSDLISNWVRFTCWCWRVFFGGGGWGAAVAHCVDENAGGSGSKECSWGWASLQTTIFSPGPHPTQQPVGISPGKPQAKQPRG